jgi:hypothetical protein
VIGVNANRVALQIKRKLAKFDVLEFIFMQVWPAPYARINNMRESLASGYLEASIKGAGNCHALARVLPICCDGCDQAIKLIALFLKINKEIIVKLWLKYNTWLALYKIRHIK